MLRGRFGDTTGRPYLEGRLILPRLNVQGDISFLVDTGADRTVLMPVDAVRLGIDYRQLRGSHVTVGLGGMAHMFVEADAAVFLEGAATLHLYFVDIAIPSFTPEIADLPSLLGRDVLDRWRMHYNPTAGTLSFKVLSADRTLQA